MYEKILVPVDGSRAGNKALDHVVEIAKRFDSEVLLVRVVRPARMYAADMGGTPQYATAELMMEAAEKETAYHIQTAKRYLNSKRRELEALRISARVFAMAGDAAEEIVKLARSEKVDLIVMTTRGRRGITRALLGSVADEVIKGANAPVLVLRR